MIEEIEWQSRKSAPEGIWVMTRINDQDGIRNVQLMKRIGKLWYITDNMYAYYTPTEWRPLKAVVA